MRHEFDIVGALDGRDTLILSDAYPPYVTGGAEISLEACVSGLSLERRKQIVVLTFSNKATEISLSYHNDVCVLRAPSSAPWPFSNQSYSELENSRPKQMLGTRWNTRLTIAKRVLSDRSALLAYRESRGRPSGGILTDHLIDQSDLRVRTAKKIADQMPRLQLLVSDNTRSILLGSHLLEMLPGIDKSVAIVRDNRFHCARPNQNRVVDGVVCGMCEFQCAKEDIPTSHEAIRRESLRRTASERQRALNVYSNVVVTSHELARHVGQLLDPSTQLYRIPNTFGDKEFFSSAASGVAQNLRDEIIIIGMLNENKGQLEFIRNATDWLKRNQKVVLVLCGRGDRIERAIRAHLEKHELQNSVEIRGFRTREQVVKDIRQAKLVIAPTVWPEPFGRVPLEAGILGRAVVAFANGGLNESMVDGHTGYLVEPGNYDEFLTRIDLLLNDASLRMQMEKNGAEFIARKYNASCTTSLFREHVLSPPIEGNRGATDNSYDEQRS